MRFTNVSILFLSFFNVLSHSVKLIEEQLQTYKKIINHINNYDDTHDKITVQDIVQLMRIIDGNDKYSVRDAKLIKSALGGVNELPWGEFEVRL